MIGSSTIARREGAPAHALSDRTRWILSSAIGPSKDVVAPGDRLLATGVGSKPERAQCLRFMQDALARRPKRKGRECATRGRSDLKKTYSENLRGRGMYAFADSSPIVPSEMGVRSLTHHGVSFGRPLVALLAAVLVVLGGTLPGTATQCYGNASMQSSDAAPAAFHPSPTDTVSEASPSRASAGSAIVSFARGAAPLSPRCQPVPTGSWRIDSATIRTVRPLDDTIGPQETSVHPDASAAWTLLPTVWARSTSTHPPRGPLSDSPPAQESMGTLRSVVLRL